MYNIMNQNANYNPAGNAQILRWLNQIIDGLYGLEMSGGWDHPYLNPCTDTIEMIEKIGIENLGELAVKFELARALLIGNAGLNWKEVQRQFEEAEREEAAKFGESLHDALTQEEKQKIENCLTKGLNLYGIENIAQKHGIKIPGSDKAVISGAEMMLKIKNSQKAEKEAGDIS